jgi:hypothetical protein
VTKYILWNPDAEVMTSHDPDYMCELEFAQKLDIDLFEPEETFTFRGMDFLIAQDPRRKVILKHWRDWQQVKLPPEDLSWADLVVLYSTDAITGPWNSLCKEVKQQLNCEKFICIGEGTFDLLDYPADVVHIDHEHHANKIVNFCRFEEWNSNTIKPKLFDALIGSMDPVIKPHRCFVFDNLQKHKLLDLCFVNTWGSVNYRSAELDVCDDPAIVDFRNSTVYSPFLKNGCSMSTSIPIEIYKRSWYTIVTETLGNKSNHITEKTMKPIFEKRLFVLFGPQGTLSRLHELGYKTFDQVIDESYDKEPDDIKRWSMAFEQVLKLLRADHAQIYNQINCILEHNHSWMVNNYVKRLKNLKLFLDSHLNDL